MTVRELRERLAALPDDIPVTMAFDSAIRTTVDVVLISAPTRANKNEYGWYQVAVVTSVDELKSRNW